MGSLELIEAPTHWFTCPLIYPNYFPLSTDIIDNTANLKSIHTPNHNFSPNSNPNPKVNSDELTNKLSGPVEQRFHIFLFTFMSSLSFPDITETPHTPQCQGHPVTIVKNIVSNKIKYCVAV